MSAKSVTVQLQPGIFQATLPDHRLMKPGIQYVIDWETFKKISNGARQNVIQVVSVNTTGGNNNNVWMSSNASVNANPSLTTASASPTTTLVGGLGAQGMNSSLYQTASVGTVLDGTQDEKYMYVQLGDTNACSVGDVLVWLDETNRLVTRTRPTITRGKTNVGTFAGVALGSISANYYAWIQIMGEVDQVNTSTLISVGNTLAVDPSNAGSAIAGTGEITLGGSPTSTYLLTTTGATSGTFTLTWNGLTTSSIAYNATTTTILNDLKALTGFPTNGSISGTNPGSMTISVPGYLYPITGSFGSLVGGTPSITTYSSVQSVSLNGNATGGNFTLTWNGQTSSPIPYNATATQLLAAVSVLSGWPSGSSASGGPLPSSISVTFNTSLIQFTGFNQDNLQGIDYYGTPGVTTDLTTTFGTSLTTSSSQVQGYIRSEKVKLPYKRFYSRN